MGNKIWKAIQSMFNGGRVLGIVPARKGSKRLKNKNLLKIREKSLIGWSIEAGLACKEVDSVVVSTDCEIIRSEALKYRAVSVLMRPPFLAEDHSSSAEVVEHALNSDLGEKFDWLVLLQPTSPLRNSGHLSEAFSLVKSVGALGAISVCKMKHPIEWTGRLQSDGFLDQFFKDAKLNIDVKELETRYQINGAIYIISVDSFLRSGTFFGQSGMVGYVMSVTDSVDIDTENDLEEARYLMSVREQKN